jgi:hypothetical protein
LRAVRVALRDLTVGADPDVTVAELTVGQTHLLNAAAGEDVHGGAGCVRVTVIKVQEV